jgi:hypothetical protein
VHGAAFGDGGYERLWNADSVLNVALRQPAAELTRADARSYACNCAYETIRCARGATESWRAAGLTAPEFMGLWMSAEPIVSKTKLPEDDVPGKMLTLLLKLLKANELPELAIGGAWNGILYILVGRPSLGPVALEHGAVELAVEHLKAIGSPADWVSISRGKAGRGYMVVHAVNYICRAFAGGVSRPDLAACVGSGLFDLCIEAIKAVAAAGADGLQDTHHGALQITLSVVRACRAQPGCEGKIRSAADALAFCLMNDLDYIVELGMTTGGSAAQICENARAPLCLALRLTIHALCTTQTHRVTPSADVVVQVAVCSAATKVALVSALRRNTSKRCEHIYHKSNVVMLQLLLKPLPTCLPAVTRILCRLARWSQLVRADSYYQNSKPSADTILALELCISDSNKPLLLANRDFLPYVVDALLLDADHPRAGMKPELKSWCQQHHAECLAQLAMFAPARETLRADPSVIPALEAVAAEGGLSGEARKFAEAALLALSDKQLHVDAEGQEHVMLSCACLKLASSSEP